MAYGNLLDQVIVQKQLPCLLRHLLNPPRRGTMEKGSHRKKSRRRNQPWNKPVRLRSKEELVRGEVIAHRLVERMAVIIRPSGKRAPERMCVLQSTAQNLTQLKVQALSSAVV